MTAAYDAGLFEPDPYVVHRRCPVCRGALSLDFTHTYLVRRQAWVKIGATSRPRLRVRELARFDWHQYVLHPPQMDWTQPLHVLAVLEGNVEHELHQRFADRHVRGEWFLDHPELDRWLRDLDPPAAQPGHQRLP